jgi:hypothetical protein
MDFPKLKKCNSWKQFPIKNVSNKRVLKKLKETLKTFVQEIKDLDED